MVPAPAPRAARVEVEDSFAKLRQITWAFHSPANFGAGDAELDILANALGASGTGRLYKTLVHERQLAQSVNVYQGGAQYSGMFVVTVTAQTGADLAAIEQVVTAELAQARTTPLTDAEVRRAVTQVEARMIYGLEGLMARANLLQSYNHFLGSPDRLGVDLARYRDATPDGIRATAASVIDLAHAVVIVTTPGGGK